MRIKIQFGLSDQESVNWFKEVLDFPKFLRYHSKIYEWAMYNKEMTGIYDYTFIFSETTSYSGGFYTIPSFYELFRSNTSEYSKCDCGAKYDRHFPNNHYYFCKLYKKT